MTDYRAEQIFFNLSNRISRVEANFCCFKDNICNTVANCGGGGGSGQPLSRIAYGTGSGLTSDENFTRDNTTGYFTAKVTLPNTQQTGFFINNDLIGDGSNVQGSAMITVDTVGTNFISVGDFSPLSLPANTTFVGYIPSSNTGSAIIAAIPNGVDGSAIFNQVQYNNFEVSSFINKDIYSLKFLNGTAKSEFDLNEIEAALSFEPNGVDGGPHGSGIRATASSLYFPGGSTLDLKCNGIIWTWPGHDSANGNVICTDGAGVLRFTSIELLLELVPNFTDNASAISGGLAVGNSYYNSTLNVYTRVL